jgi:hypothetical protein
MVVVGVKSDIPEINRQINEALRSFRGEGIKVSVVTHIHYSVFVEYGTIYMLPRAMVRRARQAVYKKFLELWSGLPFPPSRSDIEQLMSELGDYFLEEVRKRTPVLTGALKKSWEKEGPVWFSV